MNNKTQKIIIVGGGTAGWMAAAALANDQRELDITVIEAPNLGTIGVGEASIPGIRNFNASLGIDEIDFIKKTHATFKLGIQFEDWFNKGSQFFHPFSDYGQPLNGVDFHHYLYRCQKIKTNPKELSNFKLQDFCLASQVALDNRFAQPSVDSGHSLSDYKYAFHFDASLYANYLKDYSIERKVKHIQAKVNEVHLAPDGNILSLNLDNKQQHKADLFIDCSGFRALLIEGALKTGFTDWSHWLPVNSAIAIASEPHKQPSPYTRSCAKEAGWIWQIPLQSRFGNGYVYCDNFISDDHALVELKKSINEKTTSEARQLRFKTGIRNKFWNKNCVALGLASGFLEPLESTSISLIQTGLSRLLMFFPDNGFNKAETDEANRLALIEMERIRDFIILHYKYSQRQDSDFWRYVQEMEIPDTLQHKVELFKHAGHMSSYELESFGPSSWLSLFDGMNIRPQHQHVATASLSHSDLISGLNNMKDQIKSTSKKAMTHQDFINKHCKAF
ncbi:tryptophan halogenase family protein [Agaribacterium sp. ZY112]|uniref:tryptophan halogenase family protein n=1 Tax=Agaribacterium sp. ZY112 TaxID=3233574 RepID=UPI0035247BDC